MKRKYLLLLLLLFTINNLWSQVVDKVYLFGPSVTNDWNVDGAIEMTSLESRHFYWVGQLNQGDGFKFLAYKYSGAHNDFGIYSGQPSLPNTSFENSYTVNRENTNDDNPIVVSESGIYSIEVWQWENPTTTFQYWIRKIPVEGWSIPNWMNISKASSIIGSLSTPISFSEAISTNWDQNYFSSYTGTITVDANLSLADKTDVNLPRVLQMGGSNTVTYTRQAYQDGGWETLLLPFTVTSTLPADYEFQELNTGADNTSIIHFNIVTSLSANTPYVMRYTGTPAGGTAEVSFSGTQVQTNTTASSNANKFTGIYSNSDKDDFPGFNIYGMNAAGTKFVKINTTGTALNAYRAFLKVPEASGAPEYRALLEGETTGIEQKVVLSSLRAEGRQGAIQFIASVAQQVSLYSIEGKLVETLYLEEGETLLEGLLPGVYLVKNFKIIVK